MALVTRLSRLFQADFHAVLDRIEEPDLQLRQAVREMQFALDATSALAAADGVELGGEGAVVDSDTGYFTFLDIANEKY